MEDVNMRKVMAQKQKELKAKYTLVDKKKDQPRTLNAQPTKIDWKKASNCHKGVTIPSDKGLPVEDSDD